MIFFLFSSIADNVWGPGHGNVFYNEETDDYIFVYLEYGDGGTTRQVYANRMEFNEDGTIKTLVPDEKGVGYLAVSQEQRENKALKASFSASSIRSPRTSKVEIETQPNCPLADKTSLVKVERTHIYHPGNAGDRSNGTRWMAETNDDHPWLMVDLGEAMQVTECQFAFVHPAEGHAWHLEKSNDGTNWQPCAGVKEVKACSPHVVTVGDKVRYLRLHIDKGAAGLWEWKIY